MYKMAAVMDLVYLRLTKYMTPLPSEIPYLIERPFLSEILSEKLK
jgi:hypothetical protein